MAEKLGSLKELFTHELKDILGAEKMILKALPKMMAKASSPSLKEAFNLHIEQTKEQVRRLEQVFGIIGEEVEVEMCEGVKGIIKEGEEMMEMEMSPSLMDAAIVSSAQKVEHYEISAYGAICTYAEELGLMEVKEILGLTLEEEKQTDLGLNVLAKNEINLAAKESSTEKAA